MDWMQALFLLKFTKVECDMIYKKYFFNVEKCALKTNILNKQAKNNTINNNSNTYNYNISNEHINGKIKLENKKEIKCMVLYLSSSNDKINKYIKLYI
ncbi:hypothetical protein PFMALIP_01089 [Plasmodium falciparum MaliPS096_E11]|uniref:Uncharacterized protein n=1 Tax=Plasmodium falciparum MaliPS096_E11 TaxID=1036727 RepID=A0A024WW46_PLAFA|nr:hypothetical protein PFMALIP_01089 [Plasmodium falciparum MaliPS096_E11]